MSRVEYFPGIGRVPHASQAAAGDLAFRHYDPDRIVSGRKMRDHLRFSVCWWHSFSWHGSDVFGAPTRRLPWVVASDSPMQNAERQAAAAFEFFAKLGVDYFTFHDRDVAPEGADFRESQDSFRRMVDVLERHMAESGIKLLWGTANLFSHPRYAAGAATSTDPEVFACAAAQVADALDATQRLGGANYVLWGGREGYDCLLNTDLKQEKAQFGRFLQMVVEHKHKIGFKGDILIEPKPHEPTKHQYDFDVETIYGFLLANGLEKEVKMNIEANHATLSGHSFEHEIASAINLGIFGSIDMNRGDPQNGWDTDQFPNDIREITTAMYYILKNGGFQNGGNNFDAKVRRQSIDAADLFHGHIGGVDILARSLLNAAALIEGGELDALVTDRYAGWNSHAGKALLSASSNLEAISDAAVTAKIDPQPRSGRQEYVENIVSRYN